jgi:hypothetical protein
MNYKIHISIGDKEKFIAAGDPLPEGDVYTIYRGVAGKGQRRKVRGLSWTALLDVACWFALRLSGGGLEDPAVYKGKIRKEDVYCYVQDRNEEEFICRPKSAKRLDMTLEEMRQRTHARQAHTNGNENKKLAELEKKPAATRKKTRSKKTEPRTSRKTK